MFVLSLLVTVSRMTDNQHFLVDCVVGAIAGTLVALFFVVIVAGARRDKLRARYDDARHSVLYGVSSTTIIAPALDPTDNRADPVVPNECDREQCQPPEGDAQQPILITVEDSDSETSQPQRRIVELVR